MHLAYKYNGITSIGQDAFKLCYKIVEVYNLSSLDIKAGSLNNGYIGYYAKVVHTSLDEESILKTPEDGYVFAVVNNSEIYLVDYIGNETELTLPESYNGNNYEIYQYAFYKRNDITKVTIPDNVTTIEERVFEGCTSLTSITIPNSVTSIEYRAFYGCTSLTSVTIPNSVTSIGDSAFSGCSSLTWITIPDSVTSIGDRAFCTCTALTTITIPDSVTTIGDFAFEDCTSLTEINFNATSMNDLSPDSDIFRDAGQNGDGIKVTIGKNVTKIPANLFYLYWSHSMIVRVEFEEGSVCESIGNNAFKNCTSLTSIIIPDSVTTIGDYSFYYCYKLTIYCEATEQPSGWDSSWNNSACPVYWYSETEPTSEGNYWHYGDNGEIVVWE